MVTKRFCRNHPNKPYYAKGFCKLCYKRHRRCLSSKRCKHHSERPVFAAELCEACYKRQWRTTKSFYGEKKRLLRAIDKNYRARHNFLCTLANHKISEDEYIKMLNVQQGRCALSKEKPGKGKSEALVIDHCHSTGKIRGLIKGRFNLALGWFRDDPELLRAAADYLEKAQNECKKFKSKR